MSLCAGLYTSFFSVGDIRRAFIAPSANSGAVKSPLLTHHRRRFLTTINPEAAAVASAGSPSEVRSSSVVFGLHPGMGLAGGMAEVLTGRKGGLTRRGFLKSSGPAAAVCLAGPARSAAEILVDTHLHCFAGPADPAFPYHPNAPYRPDRTATPEHLLQCMNGAGIEFAVVVHPEPYQDDHRYLRHCLEIGKRRLRGTCLFFADQPRSIDRMQALARDVPLVAARIHAYAPDRLPPFGRPELAAYWKAVGEAGLAVQLHFEPRYAPGFEPLIREHPEITVIIDHLGRPFQGTPEEHDVVLNWSRFPNTIMKLSSIPSPSVYPHRDPAPVIRRICDLYGPERILYGGGFSADATGESWRGVLEHARSFLTDWSAADQAKVLGGNAVRLFGLR